MLFFIAYNALAVDASVPLLSFHGTTRRSYSSRCMAITTHPWKLTLGSLDVEVLHRIQILYAMKNSAADWRPARHAAAVRAETARAVHVVRYRRVGSQPTGPAVGEVPAAAVGAVACVRVLPEARLAGRDARAPGGRGGFHAAPRVRAGRAPRLMGRGSAHLPGVREQLVRAAPGRRRNAQLARRTRLLRALPPLKPPLHQLQLARLECLAEEPPVTGARRVLAPGAAVGAPGVRRVGRRERTRADVPLAAPPAAPAAAAHVHRAAPFRALAARLLLRAPHRRVPARTVPRGLQRASAGLRPPAPPSGPAAAHLVSAAHRAARAGPLPALPQLPALHLLRLVLQGVLRARTHTRTVATQQSLRAAVEPVEHVERAAPVGAARRVDPRVDAGGPSGQRGARVPSRL